MTMALTTTKIDELVPASDMLQMAHSEQFLRLPTADGDASPQTIRSYYTNAARFVSWCRENGIDPPTATDQDIRAYRGELVSVYAPAFGLPRAAQHALSGSSTCRLMDCASC